jgi:hypothetical protein
MILLENLEMLTIGDRNLNLQSFDCGRLEVNVFFSQQAQAYQEELFGKTYFFEFITKKD